MNHRGGCRSILPNLVAKYGGLQSMISVRRVIAIFLESMNSGTEICR